MTIFFDGQFDERTQFSVQFLFRVVPSKQGTDTPQESGEQGHCTPHNLYSQRSAISGSTRDASRAGKYAAKAATVANVTVALAIVTGSVASTPDRRPETCADAIYARPTATGKPDCSIDRDQQVEPVRHFDELCEEYGRQHPSVGIAIVWSSWSSPIPNSLRSAKAFIEQRRQEQQDAAIRADDLGVSQLLRLNRRER